MRIKGISVFYPIDDGVVYVKSEEDRKCLVILNPYDKELKFTLPFALKGKKISDLFQNQEYMMETDDLVAIIQPYGASILLFSDDNNAVPD